jgi:predicted PurR-regulated permease PerM
MTRPDQKSDPKSDPKSVNSDLRQLLIVGLGGPTIALNVWVMSQFYRYFEHLITIVVIAAILAFLLNYLVLFFERFRVKHTPATLLVITLTVALFVVLGVTLLPSLIEQTTQLMEKIPGWLDASRNNVDMVDKWFRLRNLPIDLKGYSGRLNSQIESQLKDIAKPAIDIALGTVSGFVDAILITVLAFYMLLYGARLWRGLLKFLPETYAVPLSASLRLNFHNFFLSQVVLALFMVVALIPFFLWLKVPFALLFSLLIGVSELIPFIGATLGIGIVVLLLLFQSSFIAFQVAFVAVVLQQIRDNLIAPKLMGDFTGLNPIWVFVSLLVGLQIAGLLGVFVAVPIAGTIKSTIDALQEREFRRQALEEPRLDQSV